MSAPRAAATDRPSVPHAGSVATLSGPVLDRAAQDTNVSEALLALVRLLDRQAAADAVGSDLIPAHQEGSIPCPPKRFRCTAATGLRASPSNSAPPRRPFPAGSRPARFTFTNSKACSVSPRRIFRSSLAQRVGRVNDVYQCLRMTILRNIIVNTS